MAKETKEKRKIDVQIDALFQVLPASSMEQIRLGLQRELKERLDIGLVAQILAHLRKNVDEYGWTVPHVKRGPSTDGDNRFFAVLVESDGSFTFDDQHRNHLDSGAMATMGTVATQAKNLSVILDVCMQYERSRARKAVLGDMLEDITYVAKKAARVRANIETMVDERNVVAMRG